MDLEPAVQTHGLPASHCFWFSTATMSPAPPAAFTSRGDRWQARASCLTFPHAAGAMDKIQASTDRSVGRRHELVNRTNENILYKRPMSRAFSAATILMGSNCAFTSLRRKPTDADSCRARENSVPLLSIQADVAAVAYLRGTRRQGGEGLLEPLRAAISAIPARRRPTTADFEKASVQGSSAVR